MDNELRQLVVTIVDRHHAVVRRTLATLPALLEKDGAREARSLFSGLALELEGHMRMEEDVVFPWVREVARALDDDEDPPEPSFGDPEGPLTALEEEHATALGALARLASLADTSPSGAEIIRAFCADMKEHVRLEDEVLFPELRRLLS